MTSSDNLSASKGNSPLSVDSGSESAEPTGQGSESASIELSVVMPCLDEAETLATCIDKIRPYLTESGVEGEIIS